MHGKRVSSVVTVVKVGLAFSFILVIVVTMVIMQGQRQLYPSLHWESAEDVAIENTLGYEELSAPRTKSSEPLVALGQRWIADKGYEGFLKDLKVVTYGSNVTSEPVRLEPSVVSDIASTLLIYVYSATPHFKYRRWIRETWGNPHVYQNRTDSTLQPAVVFILAQPWGDPHYDVIMRDVADESLRHGDIVLFDIGEHYDNLTLKGLAAMNWVLNTYTHIQLFLKMDDDLMLDMFWWLDQAENKSIDTTTIYTHKMVGGGRTKRGGRWAVTWEEYPHVNYPPYCSGHGYLLPRQAIKKLLSAVPDVAMFRMEDTFLTGILAEKARVHRMEITCVKDDILQDCKNVQSCVTLWLSICEKHQVLVDTASGILSG